MMVALVIGMVLLISTLLCRSFANRRGRNPVFWGIMGEIFSPFTIPLVLMSKPKDKV